MYKYFIGCKSLAQVKEVYKQKAKLYHPDTNPNVDLTLMVELNAEYAKIKKEGISAIPERPTKVFRENKNKAKKKYNFNTKVIIQNEINKMYNDIKKKGHKPYSLVYKFIDFITDNDITLEIEHLIIIRNLLGYKIGWEKFEYEKLTSNN